MLAEERMAIILEIINEQKAVKLSQLCEMLDASISTVRRDINSLADMGKIVKVHGGAMVLDDNFSFIEHNVEEKLALFTEEKIAIAKYAASLIEYGCWNNNRKNDRLHSSKRCELCNKRIYSRKKTCTKRL